ncbi:ATP-binding cassette domain-containing protein [Schleiferilactobacillus perolens]|uniref:ATP-binding cassette domain-containing protein n=1 Tax=Schleiferilactobacillus perolens TaxID=100468 RepID=UPI002353E5E7|nr:ABC transporter ATP-binding protein [Schleiferilactobacillus perolens]MCI2170152.1 ABC transporter ATP-binding protein/permease [Schleiferilactobacillus perolens]
MLTKAAHNEHIKKGWIIMGRYLRRFPGQLSGVLILIALVQGITVWASTLNANLLDALIQFNMRRFLMTAVFLMVGWIVIALLTYIVVISQTRLIQNIDIAIRQDLTMLIQHKDYETFSERTVGAYVSWFTNDIQMINTQGLTSFFMVTEEIFGTSFALVALWQYHWTLAGTALVLAGLIISVPRVFNRVLNQTNTALTEENEHFVNKTEDVLSGFDFLFAFHALSLITQRIVQSSQVLKQRALNQSKAQTAVQVTGFLGNVIAQVTLMGLSGLLAMRHLVTVGTLSAAGSLAGNVFNNLGNMSNYLGMMRGTRPIFAKYAAAQPAVRTKKDPVSRIFQAPLIALQQVTFKYPQQPIFRDVSLSFQQGQKYLLEGPSGAGKSTLLKIIAGYLTTYTGIVSFEGQNYRAWGQRTLMDQILYLAQTPQVISGSVSDNLQLTKNYSVQEMIHVLQRVGLITAADQGPDFLRQDVGAKGSSLSGGQLQRLALARGLLRGYQILLLDEGTSAVDAATAVQIERDLLTDPTLTLIMISHTPHAETTPLFDHIIQFPVTTSTDSSGITPHE